MLRCLLSSAAMLLGCVSASAQIAPTVTEPPVSQIAAVGSAVTFAVTASGTEPLTYQWYRLLTPIAGATNRTLTLPNVSADDTNAYVVRIANAAGSVDSRQANLNVIAVEDTAPVSQGISSSADSIPGAARPVSTGSVNNNPPNPGYSSTAGSRFLLSSTVTGLLPMTLQWTRDGVPLAGQTTQLLFLDNAQVSDSGVYRLTATNARGAATSMGFTIAVTPLARRPFIESQPLSRTLTVGLPVSFKVSARGESPFTYQWLRNGVVLPGATNAVLTLASVGLADQGFYEVRVTNLYGVSESNQANLVAFTPSAAPVIVTPPATTSALIGSKVTFSVVATGTAPLSYQWYKNGEPIFGEITSELVLHSTFAFQAGSYTVKVTNSSGAVTSAPAILTLTPSSRIANLSVLTSLADPTDSFTLGFIVGGTGTTGAKPVVLRAAGPSLGVLGVTGALDDPKLEIYAGPTKIGENDNWAGATALASAFTTVGAFAYASPNSRDAAVAMSLTTRDNSVKISSANGGTGSVIAEIYDATFPSDFTPTTPRLLNVSVLKNIGTGLTVGFVVAGNAGKSVLVRAIGPTLSSFGITNALADPFIALTDPKTGLLAGTNDDWPSSSAFSLADTFASVGAFPLPLRSKDAAFVLNNLPPGSYTVQVTGVGGATGVALIEVYELP